uniref:CSON001616 protein n=1 Tax=Culicoides sonorensis TaxID=179676 RepID=A0A336MNC4_CULSO
MFTTNIQETIQANQIEKLCNEISVIREDVEVLKSKIDHETTQANQIEKLCNEISVIREDVEVLKSKIDHFDFIL